ncbi:unnamed protein product [Durusdinium trenchii]|uniref:Reverse transcriptase domain-containing protein n=1 Tax=Durusdinium trenchii TaxID=1381693 RepID=A0ABP0SEI3_9DINO
MGSAATAELAACPAEDPEDAALLDFLSEDPDRARRLLSLAARAERLMPSVTAPVPARVMRGAEVAHWTSLTHEDLRQAAKPCRGTSAGLDGWTTEEVYAFSDDMLATLAAFYNKCESLGQAPAAWKMTRQVHLSKDKKLQSDGSSLAGDLRPFMSETLPVGIPVSSSLPQGDCFSMLAMTCLLLPAVNDIRTREVNVEQVVYADDRSFACATPQQLKRMTEHWTRWAGILGLRENGSKAQYYHARSGGRRDLERIGLPSECISDRIRILGFTFAGLRPRKAGPHEQSRLEEAKAKVHEISAWTLCMCRCALIVAKSSAEERGTRTDRISIARRAWLVVCTVNQFAVRNSETVRPGRAFCCHCETSRAVVCARTGAAQERSLAEGGQNASDGQVQRLLVEAVPALPGFQGAKSGRLFQAKTQEGFRCESGDESLAEDLESIAFRRLELSIDQSTRASSMFGGLLGEPEPELSRLFLIEARVSVLARDDGATPLLMAALDRHESEGPLEVSEDDQFKNDVTVLYDCWRKGSSRVELRLVLAPEVDGPRTEICMAWLKSCGQGFAALQVRHGQSLIFPAPADHAPVPPLLAAEGTLEEVTKLQFSSLGAMRLKMPKVSSDEQLKVEIRGLASADAIEVTTSEVLEISVLYSCLGAGVMEVELALEQAVLSAAHAPEVLHLHWRKRCGDSVYRFVDVYLKSDLNKTQVVSKGTTLPGFMHCPKEAVSGAEDGTKPLTKGTECQPEALEVSPKEVKTTVELRLDPEGHQLPPAFQPHPDLSFDRKILRAYVVQPTSELFRKTQPSSLRANTNAMTVRYSCHKAGVSLIVVTIYVMKHKPIDFAWRKRCSEPKVHTSKALTAPQAMTFAFLVCGGIGLIVCMVCLFCSGDQDKNQLFQGHRRPGREVEFKPIGASPKVGYEYEEEVMQLLIFWPGQCRKHVLEGQVGQTKQPWVRLRLPCHIHTLK